MDTVTNERRRTRRISALRISTLVFLLAGVLIMLAASSLVFVGHIASTEADAQASANEKQLFDNALRDRLLLIARDQLSVARWDRAVDGVVLAFDKAYIRDEMVDSLWYDFGHERTYFVAPNGRVRAEATRQTVNFNTRKLAIDDDVRRIAEAATKLHQANRISLPGGYGQRSVPRAQIERISALGFAMLDGWPALVSAMAIVPDDGTAVLPEGPPVILVSAKFIDADLIKDLNTQLTFRNMAFVTKNTGTTGRDIISLGGRKLGAFTWTSTNPGAHIWSVIIPIILGLGGLLAITALGVARLISKLSTRLETSEQRNHHLARHDSLTGLANRLQFDAGLEAAAAGLPQSPFAVIACDLDRFKAVNDTYGHASGDAVIRAIADRLAHVVGAAGLVCRIGGDEFVILMSAVTDRPRLSLLSTQIIAETCASIALPEGQTTDVGISLGVAVAPECGTTAIKIMAAADAALYDAKERGRGVAVFFNDQQATTGTSADEVGASNSTACDAA